MHGATDGKVAKTGNKKYSGVSDMCIRIVKFFTNTIILIEVNISFFQGISIHEAARQGDLNTVRHLTNEGMDVNIKDDDGVSQFG